MALTARELNRSTLARQLLLTREPLSVPEGVRRVVALQAQEPASPYLALWNRIADFDPADLDAAFADYRVVKASLIRLTLHAVHADDYPGFHTAMVPSLRSSRLDDSRFTDTGLSAADADAFLPEFLDFLARPRTWAEIGGLIAERFGEPQPRMWWALRQFAPLHHAPTGGPWSFAAQAPFVAASTPPGPDSHDAAVQGLLLRYLEAFGPASARDFGQFSILRSPAVSRALEALRDRVVARAGPDGETLFDVAGTPTPPVDAVAPPRLLGMWDNIHLAYLDRSRVIPPTYRPLVIRRNGDVLPVLLVDGYVAGVWRPTEGGIEAMAFHGLDDETWEGLAEEARALVAFLAERQSAIYGRYARWWSELPGYEVRRLPA